MFEFDLEEDFCSIYVDETILWPFIFNHLICPDSQFDLDVRWRNYPRPCTGDVDGPRRPDKSLSWTFQQSKILFWYKPSNWNAPRNFEFDHNLSCSTPFRPFGQYQKSITNELRVFLCCTGEFWAIFIIILVINDSHKALLASGICEICKAGKHQPDFLNSKFVFSFLEIHNWLAKPLCQHPVEDQFQSNIQEH